jgi:SAM-dependent methyltransferase
MTLMQPAVRQLARTARVNQDWDHDAELLQLQRLWDAEKAHLSQQDAKTRRQLHYLTKHLDYEPQIRRHLRAVDRMTPYIHGRILEWGCRHAPDSAILTMRLGQSIECHGADIREPSPYAPFHEFSELTYRQLTHPVALPYPDEHFDTIVAHGVLEHVPDPHASLDELHRVLRPGGALLIDALPYRYSYTEAWLRLTRGPSHERRYSAGHIRTALASHGFEVFDIQRVGVLPGMLNRTTPRVRRTYARASRIIDRVDRLLERTPLNLIATSLFVASHRLVPR